MKTIHHTKFAQKHYGTFILIVLAIIFMPLRSFAKTAVFWQPGFPTVASQPIERSALTEALGETDTQFVDLKNLEDPSTLLNADLLVLPYGSALPSKAWKSMEEYLKAGGNLLVIGGQPLRVPVAEVDGKFVESRAQDSYAHELDFRHTYEVPVPADSQFAWKAGYTFPQTPHIRARTFFAVEGRLDGLGYMVDNTGLLVAAPVIVANHITGPLRGSRVVALDFDPEPGFWESQDGISLIHESAVYASHGATDLSVETLFSAIRPGVLPLITIQ